MGNRMSSLATSFLRNQCPQQRLAQGSGDESCGLVQDSNIPSACMDNYYTSFSLEGRMVMLIGGVNDGVKLFGEMLFAYPFQDVDFYLPQLVNIYLKRPEASSLLDHYFVVRCLECPEFANELRWLLAAYGCEKSFELTPKKALTIGQKFSTEKVPEQTQEEFINSLLAIGRNLKNIHTKEERTHKLKLGLEALNRSLPADVWVPLYAGEMKHSVLRIPEDCGCVLNSKNKAPYCIYVEVLREQSGEIGDSRTSTESKQMLHTPDDPSASVMSEPWHEKVARIRAESPYGSDPRWYLLPVIVKTGDDLRQELLAYQFLTVLQDIWKDENLRLTLRPYKIVVCSEDSGMIEPIVNACSLHQIKRNLILHNPGRKTPPTLVTHFVYNFGHIDSESFQDAQVNFVRSCAAYCLACYLLQVKDRHNGNILMDAEGHIIHIDFGFILSTSPQNLGFENSPFKLTSELVEVMGGEQGDMFLYFKALLLKGLIAAQKHYRRLVSLVEIQMMGSKLPCFQAGKSTLEQLEQRFLLNESQDKLLKVVDSMVDTCLDSFRTRCYDTFQYLTNGIL
ncbi:hypothetical protein L596_020916 [Steinernema carpocapsae]|uniref:Phosphatidylinositol 4-kinase beta n=1 Tax=Steinernema carpocapsae TaxID=34508 RepID=A0A4U5MVN7_STECR|nr:hypothetical protein L596_020916 [Steinernema carpocapsae]